MNPMTYSGENATATMLGALMPDISGPLGPARLDLQETPPCRTGREFLGLWVVGKRDGTRLGCVCDLILHTGSNRILALVLAPNPTANTWQTQAIPWPEVLCLGKDTVMVTDARARVVLRDYPAYATAREEGLDTRLAGCQAYTLDGAVAGPAADMCFDEESGRLLGLDSRGDLIPTRLHADSPNQTSP